MVFWLLLLQSLPSNANSLNSTWSGDYNTGYWGGLEGGEVPNMIPNGSGFVWGYEGLINNIIDKIISRNKIKYKILLTGGYANFFSKMIKKKVVIDQDITIKGIANAYKELI